MSIEASPETQRSLSEISFKKNSNKLSSYYSEMRFINQAIGQPINISWGSHF